MAKKSKKTKKSSSDGIRDAVERTFQGAAGGASGAQKRVQEVFDDFGTALLSLREAIDERRVIDTLETLRDEVRGLVRRVSALEGSPQAARSAASPQPPQLAPRLAQARRQAQAGRS